MERFKHNQRVKVIGDVAGGVSGKLAPIPDGETVSVFEDWGQAYVNVMRDNGQLRVVARGALVKP